MTRHTLYLFALLACAFVLYQWRLASVPVYLHDAEILFALHARDIAGTLHDSNGRFLPLYFQMPEIGANVWFHPLIVYAMALSVKVFRFSEWSLRLPSVLVGMADVALMYLVARRLFRSETYGLVAAALLAMTPAHFIHSRVAMDYLYPVPFVLAWMLCLATFEQESRPRLLFLAGLVLGVGMYSYIGAVVLMPLYLGMTLLFLLPSSRAAGRQFGLVLAGFGLPLVLLLVWLWQYPQTFGETIGRYGVSGVDTVHAIRGLLNYNRLQDAIAMYWSFNSPVYLFFVGSSNWVDSTRRAGVFLLPMALFIGAGFWAFAAGPRSRLTWLVVGGFVTAPLGAVFVGEAWAVQRELEVLPFGVLLATMGIRKLIGETRATRWVAAAALAAGLVMFVDFSRDYFTDYPLNSIGWFGLNIDGAVTQMLERDRHGLHPPAVYVSSTIPYGRARWRFSLAKARREELLQQTFSFDAGTNVDAMPRGSLVVVLAAESDKVRARDNRLARAGAVNEPGGGVSLVLFER